MMSSGNLGCDIISSVSAFYPNELKKSFDILRALGFNPRAGEVGHSVASCLLLLRFFLEVEAVLPRR